MQCSIQCLSAGCVRAREKRLGKYQATGAYGISIGPIECVPCERGRGDSPVGLLPMLPSSPRFRPPSAPPAWIYAYSDTAETAVHICQLKQRVLWNSEFHAECLAWPLAGSLGDGKPTRELSCRCRRSVPRRWNMGRHASRASAAGPN